MRNLFLPVTFLGALLPVSALAQETDEETICTAEVAEPATIEQLVENFRDWAGRCVRVQGLHVVRQGLVEEGLLH